MCGIAGIVYRDREQGVDQPALKAMTRALAHRGPDGEGFWLNKGIGLGHRRLSIIDPEGGAQPLSNEDETVWVVFNGEIYNFQELTHQLKQKGHRFKTRCDTEVILHAYEEEGPGSFRRFRGMFAFALWDQKKRTLFLARDPVGIKPLFYYLDSEKLLFTSELKAFFDYPDLTWKLNVPALDSYFSLGFIMAPDTIYQNCRKLKPGHYATYCEGKFEEVGYWDLASEPPPQKEAAFSEAVNEVRHKIQSAVRSHLVSDVPVGGLLSGGLDSSSVVSFLPQNAANLISTFNISFDDPRYDESSFAAEVARQFGTRHFVRQVCVQPAEMIQKIISIYDEPFGDSSAIPTYLLSQVAREHVKVVLSGDGGDENFGGYRRYIVDLTVSRARKYFPPWIRKIIHRMGLPLSGKAGTALRELGLGEGEGYFHSVSMLKPEEKILLYSPAFQAQLQGSPAQDKFRNIYHQAPSADPLARMIYADLKTLMPDDYLTKVDRASMAHGLEVRIPLLDMDLLSYTYFLPASYKIRGRTTKYLLREAMKGILPDTLLHRGKMGFEIPLARWLKGDLRKLFESRLFSGKGFVADYLDLKRVKLLWKRFLAESYSNASIFWLLLILELWSSSKRKAV